MLRRVRLWVALGRQLCVHMWFLMQTCDVTYHVDWACWMQVGMRVSGRTEGEARDCKADWVA